MSSEKEAPKTLYQNDLQNISLALTKQDYDRIMAKRDRPIDQPINKKDTRKSLA
jgi:hypothetical protein